MFISVGEGRIRTVGSNATDRRLRRFDLFAIDVALRYREGWKWADCAVGQTTDVALSVVAKSPLAWQVLFGTLDAPV